METAELKRFAQGARRQLLDQVGARLEQVLRTDSVVLREKQAVVDELQAQIGNSSKEAVIDRVAYTWFNRFCALRYIDVNHYSRVSIVSPTEGFTQPEILQEAKQGVFDESLKVDKERVLGLLHSNIPSTNPQQEAYRLLLVGACNAYHDRMPFLFEEIEDYTELLMPDDLLSEKSVLQGVRDALTTEACQDVEVIGWLYQYYISERKDEVFADLKKNKKIQPEDIPAATQLFTPHWIVRYLVENSLGRLWMLNHPDSKLVEQMEYYIRPEQEETEFLKIGSPEEIKVCDPACGSGHMLTYAFDLLYAIYEEQGYDPTAIPSLILTNNLYGIEIDERAGDLSAFALMMKARAKDKGFFEGGVAPNVCVLEKIEFTEDELDRYMEAVGRDLFTIELQETLTQFDQANNFGSLIQPKVKDVGSIRERIETKGVFENLFLHKTSEKVMKILEQAEYLSPHYHVVVTNPPYMGSGGMNEVLKTFARSEYLMSKLDTYTMFIERNLALCMRDGIVGMITIPNWMFLTSFQKLRGYILREATILSLVHNGRGIWGSDFGSCSFILGRRNLADHPGLFRRLFKKQGKVNSNRTLRNRFFDRETFPDYSATSRELTIVPGSPIAYWATNSVRELFAGKKLADFAQSAGRCKTHNDEMFVRMWWELSFTKIGPEKKWKPYNKGGTARKWFGNLNYVINWSPDAREYYSQFGGLSNVSTRNKTGVTWSGITSARPTYRLKPANSENASVSPTILPNEQNRWEIILGFLNSDVSFYFMGIINPSMMVNVGDALKFPFKNVAEAVLVKEIVSDLIESSRKDWHDQEISLGFQLPRLLDGKLRTKVLHEMYESVRSEFRDTAEQVQKSESTLNHTFIKAYGLQDELAPEVPISQVTLNCNPWHRYPDTSRKVYSIKEREAMLLEDTMKEFISYSVGNMFGRYSLDKPGLILASKGEMSDDYLEIIPTPTFAPDEDNVIPVLDEGWFTDDITERFKEFLKITFGEDHYEENFAFLEEAIGRDIRSYFLKDFYKEHLKMYKKRPIYWLFSSPGGSFNALIYMHRYRPETVSVILNDYLRTFRQKLNAHKSHLEEIERSPGASSSEKTKALKEIDRLNGILNEIQEYEDEILYPLATQKIEIDLDDGVLVNYKKFGKALKHVRGLSD